MLGGPRGSNRSQAKRHYGRVPSLSKPRSRFDRSHKYLTTFDSGYLIPFLVDEILPGDTAAVNSEFFIRLATPLYPFMDNLHVETFYFFVPNRLVHDDWVKLMGEQENPDDSIDFLTPVVQSTSSANGFVAGGLYDYMGIPPNRPLTAGTINGVQFDNRPVNYAGRAYNRAWNDWFRDENLQDSVKVDTGPGPDAEADYVLLKRGKRPDYFTSCLPAPQKGEGVSIPIAGGTFPVSGLGFGPSLGGTDVNQIAYETPEDPTGDVDFVTYPLSTNNDVGDETGLTTRIHFKASTRTDAGVSRTVPDLTVNLGDDIAAVTINELRTAFQTQFLYEQFARGGTRYAEQNQSIWGVPDQDARLQRAEYLGGGHSYIVADAVPQTAPTDDTSPQGNLAAFAYSTKGRGHGFARSFPEHGTLLGLICVYADLTYQQGVHRMWNRRDRMDYAWPALSHIGEQAVFNREIYLQTSSTTADVNVGVFGYQERFAEYRSKPGLITGKFRSDDPAPLDAWHLSQKLTSLPTLGPQFIEENVPIDRVLAVNDEPQLIMNVWHKYMIARVLPTFGIPGGIVGRF